LKPSYCPGCGHKLAKKEVKEETDGFMVWYIVFCGGCNANLVIKIKEK